MTRIGNRIIECCPFAARGRIPLLAGPRSGHTSSRQKKIILKAQTGYRHRNAPDLYDATFQLFTMRSLFLLSALIALIIMTGCTATAPSIPGAQQPLSLNQQAQFENNGYAFDAGINHIEIKDNQTIVVTLTIVNTGTQGMTLSAMPSLNNPVGESYPGSAIFFSQIAPNHQSTQKGTISIPVGTLDQFGQGSTLKIRFQGTSPVPYETAWNIDLTNLPE